MTEFAIRWRIFVEWCNDDFATKEGQKALKKADQIICEGVTYTINGFMKMLLKWLDGIGVEQKKLIEKKKEKTKGKGDAKGKGKIPPR